MIVAGVSFSKVWCECFGDLRRTEGHKHNYCKSCKTLRDAQEENKICLKSWTEHVGIKNECCVLCVLYQAI